MPPGGGTAPPTGRGSGAALQHGAAATHGSAPLAPVPVAAGPRAQIAPQLIAPRDGRATRRHGRGTRSAAHGRVFGAGPGVRVDWFGTLSRGLPRTRADLRYRAVRAPERALWLVLIDGSASMLRHGALAAAKSVALALLVAARRAGARVRVWSFREGRVEPVLDDSHRPDARARALHALPGGGSTPLLHALEQALAHCARTGHGEAARLYVLTDGRSRERPTRRAPSGSVVIDCERGPVRVGRAAALATELGAVYVAVDTLLRA